MRFLIVPCLIALALTGCKEDETERVASDDFCGAVPLQSIIGQPLADQAGLTPGADLRILEPGTVVTMDFRQDRLNIEVDDEGIVTKVYCG